MTHYVETKNLSKFYGDIKAVNRLSFTADAGEVIALLGPNGAGKSTLMNMLSGFLSPTEGDVFIMGKNIKQFPIESKESIGFLPEGSPLYPDLRVKSFLKYMSELRGLKQHDIDVAVKLSNIEAVLNQKIETLSKGYQRRVGFAQSILSNPLILLLDEPTDGLDPNQKHHIREQIKTMGKDKTIIISTHLLEEAETVCNRVLLINNGCILADGTAASIVEQTKCKNMDDAFRKLTQLEETL